MTPLFFVFYFSKKDKLVVIWSITSLRIVRIGSLVFDKVVHSPCLRCIDHVNQNQVIWFIAHAKLKSGHSIIVHAHLESGHLLYCPRQRWFLPWWPRLPLFWIRIKTLRKALFFSQNRVVLTARPWLTCLQLCFGFISLFISFFNVFIFPFYFARLLLEKCRV